MTRDERKKQIAELLTSIEHDNNNFTEEPDWQFNIADQIIALFEGWKSPQEVKEAVIKAMLFCEMKEGKDDKR
jgi:hypothetical protein